MKKRFKMSCEWCLWVIVEVDMDKLTPELATLINDFWSGASEVLEASDGDVVQAAIRRSASYLMLSVLNGYNCIGAQHDLDTSEGWPPNGEHGIRIIGFEVPDMSSGMIEFEELEMQS